MSKEINDLKQQIMWLQNRNAFLTNRQEALRDHFAGLAMQGILTTMMGDVKADIIAKMSYILADAMIAERVKRDGND
jgi:uncharacterized protein YeeX (DUF496 family)